MQRTIRNELRNQWNSVVQEISNNTAQPDSILEDSNGTVANVTLNETLPSHNLLVSPINIPSPFPALELEKKNHLI